MDYTCILWDWNGTLADDCAIGFAAFNRVLAVHGMASTTLGFYRRNMTTPVSRFYGLFFDLSAVPFAELDAQFNRSYAELAAGLSLTEGILPVLRRFHAAGKRQAILTSSWAHVVEADAERLGVRGYFDAVLGARALSEGRKTDRARTYMEENGIPPERCLVIGDTVHDHEVAREIGADCVLCGFGHQLPEVLARCAVPVADTPARLSALLAGIA